DLIVTGVQTCALPISVEAARVHLREIYGDGPPTIVMQPELSVEHDMAWAVRFDSQEHLDTGDITQAPMVRMVVVFKDGSFVGFRSEERRVGKEGRCGG